MGAWSTSVAGNDTAQDLKIEYACAFYYYDKEEALRRIEDYAARNGYTVDDPQEYCDYVYSLADFMWRNGILTDEIRDRAVKMIEDGFGLELWEEAGEKTLNSRKKALESFKQKIMSPMGKEKKIKPKAYTEKLFEPGDVIAIKLLISGKKYADHAKVMVEIPEEEFQKYDGKYVLIQKVCDHLSWTSSLVPEVKDYWPIFRLMEGVYDEIPKITEWSDLKTTSFIDYGCIGTYFSCEGSISYYKKREYVVLGNYSFDISPETINTLSAGGGARFLWFSINRPWYNAESFLVASLRVVFSEEKYTGQLQEQTELIYGSIKCLSSDYSITYAENEMRYRETMDEYMSDMTETISKGGQIYVLKIDSKIIGLGIALNDEILYLFMMNIYQHCSLGIRLVNYMINVDPTLKKMRIHRLARNTFKRNGWKNIRVSDILKNICHKCNLQVVID